ncbi:MAG: CDP-glycerol glycerophosphotransferase family protein [Pyrinomonadaceae bacterium]
MKRPKILLLTSSLLVDRIFVHTKLIETLNEIGETVIWAVSRGDKENFSVWDGNPARVEPFPAVRPFKAFPHVYLRRLNEAVWDYRFQIPSRVSAEEHIRDKAQTFSVRAMKPLARFLAMCCVERLLENRLEKLLLSYPRSAEAEKRLIELQPSVIVVTGAFQFEQPAIFAAAKKLGIPTVAYIPSWDNITTKNRMVFKYDGYLVWSEQIKKELFEFYPAAANVPVHIIGAPQFDIFFQERFYQTREDFCGEQGLDPALPIIVYAIGSPNFLQEHHGAVELAERIVRGELGAVQMLVRPHPIHDNAALHSVFDRFSPHVRLQHTHNAGKAVAERTQDHRQIKEWINSFRHADVVVNLSSTVTIDAAIFDKPIINLDFDPQPSRADQALIRDINHRWNHFKPVAESGGVALVNDFDELAVAVKTYLREPTLHASGRRWIVRYVCEFLDGKCGERMARAICDFAGFDVQTSSSLARVGSRQGVFAQS